MCYSAKLVKDEPKHGKIENQPVTAWLFGEDQDHTVDVKKEKELCFISTITLP